ncbi:MAG: UDP-N-acetylmuramate--L-alanine ligase [Planctomycetota bacterium]|jgi:UDP-N-acetylmuramate--alanine ligase
MEICNTKTASSRTLAVSDNRLSVAGMKFHFIGAGGVGMSGLAKILLKNQAAVTGSDLTDTPVTEMLRSIGADVRIGHDAANLDSLTDAVVISAAIREDNPELLLARKRGCKIYKYAQMLGELMDWYEGIAVGGTHGKSTTSGWLVYCLQRAGMEPNFIIGADITQLGSSSGVGNGTYCVAEACEYDRSFLNLRPKIAALLNIEQDHLDYYRDEDDIVDAFRDFVLNTRPGGVLVANGQDANVKKIIGELAPPVRCETFGLDEACSFSAQNLQLRDGLYEFDVYHNGGLLGSTSIVLPGRHNALNALAVVATAVNAGMDAQEVLQLLPDFEGVDRRLTFKGQFERIIVLDDYAHHPTEIRASLEAVRQRYQPRRIWCVFQPHQYSRTRFLLDDFAESFKFADVTIVPEIYFVRDSQQAKKEVNAQILVERMQNNGTEALFIDGCAPICDYLQENVMAGDLVVTMGAGDIWKVADEYIQRVRRNS